MLLIKDLTKKYQNSQGGEITIFKDFNLEIKPGEFVAIFGPNGCGKSTLLNIMGGLVDSDLGSVEFANKNVGKAKVGFVFQDYRNSLFPWMRAKDNIAFPLKIGINKKSNSEIKTRINDLSEQFHLKFDFNAYPYNLSGGQQQSVSLLRGIINKPEIFLLDEPFASLDYQTTLSMMQKLLLIWQKTKVTTVFISHEIDEAIFLAQRIILLSNKPTQIIETIDNPLAYPRKPEIIGTQEFAELKQKILTKYLQLLNLSNS
jgi:NitT/TauT family transport system ATP-binding protein